MKTIEIDNLHCLCSSVNDSGSIAYILYPMDMLNDWIEAAAEKYNVTIVVITGMDWQNVFSPWPEKGVPAGDPDFKGRSPQFLSLMQNLIIPLVEADLGINNVKRALVGVSMSGLFALWQWMECDTFDNIASLSGSFWYKGFIEWMKKISIPHKCGKGFFLLGDQEAKTMVKAFQSVAKDTEEIIGLLRNAGIDVEFKSVTGNHFTDPIPRLNAAFEALYK